MLDSLSLPSQCCKSFSFLCAFTPGSSWGNIAVQGLYLTVSSSPHLAAPFSNSLPLFETGFHVPMLASNTLCSLELLILLPPPSEFWDYRCVPPFLAYDSLGTKPIVHARQAFYQLIHFIWRFLNQALGPISSWTRTWKGIQWCEHCPNSPLSFPAHINWPHSTALPALHLELLSSPRFYNASCSCLTMAQFCLPIFMTVKWVYGWSLISWAISCIISLLVWVNP